MNIFKDIIASYGVSVTIRKEMGGCYSSRMWAVKGSSWTERGDS